MVPANLIRTLFVIGFCGALPFAAHAASPSASTADALRGQARYLRLCAGCHSAAPDYRAKSAANRPDALRLAVNAVSGMGVLQPLLTNADYDDIAAYLGDTTLNENVLTVAPRGDGLGRITATRGNMDCGGICAWAYPLATDVVIDATPLRGSTFMGWSGACNGTGSCRVNMNGAQTAFAQFMRNSAATDYSGLWWGGIAENGWGVSITHRAASGQQFITLYIYDKDGAPTWLVVPGGVWAENFTVLLGKAYRPSGSPLNNYRSDQLIVDDAIGEVTLRFASATAIDLSYQLDGLSGRKQLQRQLPANTNAMPAREIADLWWGGEAENGWGLSIAQQADTQFAVWYSYNSNARPTWWVMSDGALNMLGNNLQYSGTLYQTRGAAWLGASYDPAPLQITPVGTLRLNLGANIIVNDIAMDAQFLSGEFAGTTNVKKIVRQPF